jgi:CheY-like chemotaxis protein
MQLPNLQKASALGVTIPEVKPGERWLSPNDIGKILSVTGEAVKQWIYHRRLPAVKLANGYWKVSVKDFEEFLKSRFETRRCSVMIFDTQESAARLSKVVADLGAQPLSSQNAVDFLLKALDQHPALVVVNIAYGGEQSWQLMEKLQATKGLRSVPLLCLGNGGEDPEKLLAYGVRGYQEHPVDPVVLEKEIRSILSPGG